MLWRLDTGGGGPGGGRKKGAHDTQATLTKNIIMYCINVCLLSTDCPLSLVIQTCPDGNRHQSQRMKCDLNIVYNN